MAHIKDEKFEKLLEDVVSCAYIVDITLHRSLFDEQAYEQAVERLVIAKGALIDYHSEVVTELEADLEDRRPFGQ